MARARWSAENERKLAAETRAAYFERSAGTYIVSAEARGDDVSSLGAVACEEYASLIPIGMEAIHDTKTRRA